MTDLAGQFRDPSVWGLSADRCHVVLEPGDSATAIGPLRSAVDSASDTLLVYYAGHGLIDPDKGDLWLGLPGSLSGEPDTAMPYDWVRRQFLRSRAERRIMIIDCCYSGRALGTMGEAQTAVANGAMVEGTYVLASAGESSQALALPGEQHTVFTGELINLLAQGVPDGPELLELDNVYRLLSEGLRARSRPEPQKRVRNSAGQLHLFRNRAYAVRKPGAGLVGRRYELGKRLLRDAATDTYHARDTTLGRPVTLKVMRPQAAGDSRLAEGFVDGAKSRALLHHPLTTMLLDMGHVNRGGVRCPYLVTEAVVGSTLTDRIREGLPHPDETIGIVRDVLSLLEYAHGVGVFGWNLNPDSVVLTPGHHVKLVDLAEDPGRWANRQPIATPPEAGDDDLRAAATLFYTLLTGRSPWPVPDPRGTGWPTRPSVHQPQLSDELDTVALLALFPQHPSGYGGAKQLSQAVAGLRGRAIRYPAPPSEPPSDPPGAPSRAHLPQSVPQSDPKAVHEERIPRALNFAAGSHRGSIRDSNKDSGYAGPRLLAIADGIDHIPGGEVASAEVISTIVTLDDDVPGSDMLTSLATAVQRANGRLRELSAADPQLAGMASTLTALSWTGQRMGLVHLGSSRVYFLRDGVLTQITQDHTWVQRLVDEAGLTGEQATVHAEGSRQDRVLDGGAVDPDLSIHQVLSEDRYLLCSHGLSGVISHETMEETLAAYQGPQETVQNLIRLALRAGGAENVTCIIADVLDIADINDIGGRISDTPIVVGAVAAAQMPLPEPGSAPPNRP
ncbi:hypothetical protein G6045_01270 [Streptomyces sp. YC504]|uniref:Protein kinase n=1 Tax=Streptomyces mesophilus TaxID=1775132 RepID=A0A6G4XCE7_9ACTN|nr:caspase family protein [Streptomyces mesophilus]NGO74321.1 hypothetical protein [Streptomyces mesophilus]